MLSSLFVFWFDSRFNVRRSRFGGREPHTSNLEPNLEPALEPELSTEHERELRSENPEA